MQDNFFDELIVKAKALYKAPPLDKEQIKKLENELQVILPDDFQYICSQYNYEYLDFFSFYNFSNGVITKTSALRKSWGLPIEYLVLAEDDVSVVLMRTISTTTSEIIWCNEPDFFNLCEGKPMEYKPTIFPSFTDFFEYLLEEEEKLQAED